LIKTVEVQINEEFAERLFSKNSKAQNHNEMISLSGTAPTNSHSNEKRKHVWFEGDFYPVIGTSVFLEIDSSAASILEPQLLGLSE
jgi:hypothetical protein